MINIDLNKNELSLLSLVPQVLRARDFRLYTGGSSKGKARKPQRLIDLWQNGGAAVLGHTPPLLLREIKNTASRGLYAPFPHFTEQRFLKALSQLLPDMSFRIYAHLPNELSLQNIVLWRPYFDFCKPNKSTAGQPSKVASDTAQQPETLLIPVLPGIQGWRNGLPFGLCVVAVPNEQAAKVFVTLPPNDFLPPVLLAAATRGIWDLIAAAPKRANIQYQRINKILKASLWLAKGIYLFPRTKPEPETWEVLFCRFLDAGFLLPPLPEHPLILPGILSPGEEAKLAEVLGG